MAKMTICMSFSNGIATFNHAQYLSKYVNDDALVGKGHSMQWICEV